MSNGNFFIGLALGTLAGGMITCFAHSAKGRKLRKDLCNSIHDLQGGCCNKEGCTCENFPQPDEVLEVVAGKVNAAEEKPKA